MADLTPGKLLIEGKTKQIFELPKQPGACLVQSKDRITAGDGVRAHNLTGKAEISTATTCKVFELLNTVGLKTHYIKRASETAFVSKKCDMIPIEWVTRRVATGSFLKRNIGVKEGYRFNPPKLETFFKDDANHDPQWSEEVLIANELKCGGITIGKDEVDFMNRTSVAVFEVLEKAWASIDCALIDMKIEFGVADGELMVADVIDSDSWRLWPSGDKRLMKDKQVYRDLQVVTQEALDEVKANFKWIAERLDLLLPSPKALVVVLMGSPSDEDHCKKIVKTCRDMGVPCQMRVTSAHKGPEETLSIIAQYEGTGIPTIFIAVAGRSNGLGPVTSGNTAYPVINCPPVKSDTAMRDVWSSLDVPSGLGCVTVMYPEAAGLAAAQMLGLTNHVIWARLRVKALNNYLSIKASDKKIREF
ncbi:multifunctional protein ADE2 [Folsomia candida]|uniref:Multifunctional protein ADE2 n=1 Tax=Folsomia candida TaxID=158441 RepID=A0A226DKZ0_FOLCA|nr:multifunctional protein ADE2 [Folsomia candida]OXA45658.1 Multifunctional protein ADE2 [Folsomia candida]